MAIRYLTILAASLLLLSAICAQTPDRFAGTRAVQAVRTQYKSAIERLDASKTDQLFTPDSQMFETGGSERSYATYLNHHLAPELAAFKSFKFSNYKVDVRIEVR